MVMTVSVPKNKVRFMKMMFNNLPFVEPDSVSVYSKKELFLRGFEESIEEANAYMRGEVKLRSAWDVLDEL